MAQSEIQERVAKLNTQLRFGRKKPALLEAYKLRAYLQLNGLKTQEAQREIARVEKVIAKLEGSNVGGIQRLVNSIVSTVKQSLNPTEEESTQTLLDKIAEEEWRAQDEAEAAARAEAEAAAQANAEESSASEEASISP